MEDLKSVSVQILVLKDINFLSKKKSVNSLMGNRHVHERRAGCQER
jgi:hypothetical protein